MSIRSKEIIKAKDVVDKTATTSKTLLTNDLWNNKNADQVFSVVKNISEADKSEFFRDIDNDINVINNFESTLKHTTAKSKLVIFFNHFKEHVYGIYSFLTHLRLTHIHFLRNLKNGVAKKIIYNIKDSNSLFQLLSTNIAIGFKNYTEKKSDLEWSYNYKDVEYIVNNKYISFIRGFNNENFEIPYVIAIPISVNDIREDNFKMPYKVTGLNTITIGVTAKSNSNNSNIRIGYMISQPSKVNFKVIPSNSDRRVFIASQNRHDLINVSNVNVNSRHSKIITIKNVPVYGGYAKIYIYCEGTNFTVENIQVTSYEVGYISYDDSEAYADKISHNALLQDSIIKNDTGPLQNYHVEGRRLLNTIPEYIQYTNSPNNWVRTIIEALKTNNLFKTLLNNAKTIAQNLYCEYFVGYDPNETVQITYHTKFVKQAYDVLIWIDASGSMKNAIDDVRNSVGKLLGSLKKNNIDNKISIITIKPLDKYINTSVKFQENKHESNMIVTDLTNNENQFKANLNLVQLDESHNFTKSYGDINRHKNDKNTAPIIISEDPTVVVDVFDENNFDLSRIWRGGNFKKVIIFISDEIGGYPRDTFFDKNGNTIHDSSWHFGPYDSMFNTEYAYNHRYSPGGRLANLDGRWLNKTFVDTLKKNNVRPFFLSTHDDDFFKRNQLLKTNFYTGNKSIKKCLKSIDITAECFNCAPENTADSLITIFTEYLIANKTYEIKKYEPYELMHITEIPGFIIDQKYLKLFKGWTIQSAPHGGHENPYYDNEHVFEAGTFTSFNCDADLYAAFEHITITLNYSCWLDTQFFYANYCTTAGDHGFGWSIGLGAGVSGSNLPYGYNKYKLTYLNNITKEQSKYLTASKFQGVWGLVNCLSITAPGGMIIEDLDVEAVYKFSTYNWPPFVKGSTWTKKNYSGAGGARYTIRTEPASLYWIPQLKYEINHKEDHVILLGAFLSVSEGQTYRAEKHIKINSKQVSVEPYYYFGPSGWNVLITYNFKNIKCKYL